MYRFVFCVRIFSFLHNLEVGRSFLSVDRFLPDYTTSHPRRLQIVIDTIRDPQILHLQICLDRFSKSSLMGDWRLNMYTLYDVKVGRGLSIFDY